MNKIASKFRIGEKILIAGGIVGLIFLGVIWHYHSSLHSVLTDYAGLNDVYGARKSYAFEIESRLMAMRSAKESFLIQRDPGFAREVEHQAKELQIQAGLLARIDTDSAQTATEIKALTQDYLGRFKAIAEAWQIKGLDHNSGLQGAFRDRVHELEGRAANYDVDQPYLLLLQIRRGEKDLGLRHDIRYQHKVQGLLDELESTVAASRLPDGIKQQLTNEMQTYRTTFDAYAAEVLSAQDINEGKGPFRQAAHRMEAILESHHVPRMETRILQLRRREKDYLLRGEDDYVAMVDAIADSIREQILSAPIADSGKAEFTELLSAYERDFHALVEQNRRIERLTSEMNEAAERITPLVEGNLDQADQALIEMSEQIARTSATSARMNLVIAFAALGLGALFSLLIISRIVRPVREMAGLLDRLTHENPVERIATVPDGRDEINAMAASLNTMADHRATFFNWWRSSMKEAIALRDLHSGTTESERFEAAEEVRKAALSQIQQINAVRGQIACHTARIIEVSDRILKDRRHLKADDGTILRNAAEGITTLTGVIDEGH